MNKKNWKQNKLFDLKENEEKFSYEVTFSSSYDTDNLTVNTSSLYDWDNSGNSITRQWTTDNTSGNHIIPPISTGGFNWNNVTVTNPYPPSGSAIYNSDFVWSDLETENWPKTPDTIGIIYIEDQKLKLKTRNGEEIVIADLSKDDDITANLMAVIAKKKLEELNDKEAI